MLELGPIGSEFYHDPKRMVRSLGFVIMLQSFSKTIDLDANQGITLLAELLISAEYFRCDAEFLDLVDLALEGLLAEVLEQFG